jgi:hypothetical protein
MGIASSKDEYGTPTLARLPPGFLDRKGRDLRDKLDECLNEHMWYFTIGECSCTCVCPFAVTCTTAAEKCSPCCM